MMLLNAHPSGSPWEERALHQGQAAGINAHQAVLETEAWSLHHLSITGSECECVNRERRVPRERQVDPTRLA